MLKRHSRNARLALAAVVVIVLATAAYAFTASNTVPASRAGDGAGTISGYTVSAVAYSLSASDPTRIDKTTFTLDAAATAPVKAKLVSSSTTYTDCTNTGGNNWSCDFSPDVAVTTADELRVIAHS